MIDRIDHGPIGLTRTMGTGIGHGHPTTMVDSKEILDKAGGTQSPAFLLMTW
jgi:hypothetical protein